MHYWKIFLYDLCFVLCLVATCCKICVLKLRNDAHIMQASSILADLGLFGCPYFLVPVERKAMCC